MSDVESMKAELEANGYSVWGSVNPYRKPSHIETPDGFLFYGNPLNSEESQYAEVISKAYAHMQREKKFAAMEALVVKLSMAQATSWDDDGIPAYDSDYQDLIDEAKTLLGK